MRIASQAPSLPLTRPSVPAPPTRVRPLAVAHRGASAHAPENTLSAVRRAVEVGADLVEVDVQRTRDGALVLVHDDTLTRTTDATRVLPGRAPWRVQDLTWDQVSRLDAGSWKSPQFAGERVPLLADVLALLRGTRCGLQLELKLPGAHPGIVRELGDELARGGFRSGLHHLVVQSFDVAAMKELKTRMPATRIGLLGSPARANLPALATWADQVNPGSRRLTRSYVRAVQDEGLECLTWTVDSGAAMRRAVRQGVDGIITNHPERLVGLLDAA